MDAIVTLPLTAGDRRSFLTLFTPLVSQITARASGSSLKIMLNNVGFKSDSLNIDVFTQFQNYKKRCEDFGIFGDNVSFWHDAGEDYQEYFQNLILKVEKEGGIELCKEEMSWCPCGRVETLRSVVESLISEERRKSLVMGGREEKCKFCGQNLNTNVEDVIILRLENILPKNIWPSIYRDEIAGTCRRVASHPIVISRNHRHGFKARMFDREFVIDTDFRWLGYLGYLFKGRRDICIVSSVTTLNQLARVVSFSEKFLPCMNISILVHPIIRVRDGNLKLASIDIDRYLNLCGDSKIARFFLASCVQWNRAESVLVSDELDLIKKSFIQTIEVNQCGGNNRVPVSDLSQLINRKKLFDLLKSLRSKKQLTKEEIILKSIVSP